MRRCQRDLAKEFGFEIGRGNQSYQYDTLPEELSQEEMLPGDLVFYSATYYDPSHSKIHDMVHVEIFTGKGANGEGTIGSRRGDVVSEHETYRFPEDKVATRPDALEPSIPPRTLHAAPRLAS